MADLKNHFVPLHFLNTLHGITKPQFPANGLAWELFVQLLTNIIGLFCLAMRDYGLVTAQTSQVPFLVNLDTLLHLVSSTEIRQSWPTAQRDYTVATYKQHKSLFHLYTCWFYCLKSTILGAEIVDVGPLASTTIRVNLQVSFTLRLVV